MNDCGHTAVVNVGRGGGTGGGYLCCRGGGGPAEHGAFKVVFQLFFSPG